MWLRRLRVHYVVAWEDGVIASGSAKVEAINQPYTVASEPKLVGGALWWLNDWQKRL